MAPLHVALLAVGSFCLIGFAAASLGGGEVDSTLTCPATGDAAPAATTRPLEGALDVAPGAPQAPRRGTWM